MAAVYTVFAILAISTYFGDSGASVIRERRGLFELPGCIPGIGKHNAGNGAAPAGNNGGSVVSKIPLVNGIFGKSQQGGGHSGGGFPLPINLGAISGGLLGSGMPGGPIGQMIANKIGSSISQAAAKGLEASLSQAASSGLGASLSQAAKGLEASLSQAAANGQLSSLGNLIGGDSKGFIPANMGLGGGQVGSGGQASLGGQGASGGIGGSGSSGGAQTSASGSGCKN